MNYLRTLVAICCLACAATPAMALSIQTVNLQSPITNEPFQAVIVPIAQVVGSSLSDMGYDDDGCRHSSGECEYYYYVVTDPHSYFSALAAEWNEDNGNFEGALSPDIKPWVIDTFNSEWQVDQTRSYDNALSTAQALGQPAPGRKDFVMAQQSIPLEKRYQFALQCYSKRGARPVVMAKTALMGAWAIRCFCNVLFRNQAIDGGYEEVDDKVKRHVTDGEVFQLNKWLPIYREIFDADGLTNEGYMVAGLSYFGFEMRDGDLSLCTDILHKMDERFQKMDQGKSKPLLLGVVLERKRMLDSYKQFLTIACDNFIQAVAQEEFTRDDLVENKMLVIAECLRRAGREQDAFDWYTALTKCIETQPDLRASMKAQGKAPAGDAPQAVQVGWMADQHIDALVKSGLVHANEISGPEKQLLNAIVFDGLGKEDYVNPNWQPAKGMNADDCRLMLEIIGNSVHEYEYKLGNWPEKLNDLWAHQVLRDRNRVNRFYDPVNGQQLMYVAPTDPLEQLNPDTVLIATASPVPSTQGDVYFAYLVGLKVVASVHPQKPGELFVK